MREVGSDEAKTHLPELLKAVEQGETIVITRRGAPIARIVPVEQSSPDDIGAILARMRRARAGRARVSRDEILAARDEGRRG